MGWKANIVLGESESIIAEDISILVKEWGFNVLGRAATQEQLLSCIKAVHPDVVILDHLLRGGNEFSRLVREIQDMHETALIVVGHMPDVEPELRQNSTFSLLEKPFHNEELREKVEKMAGHRVA